MLVHRFYKPSAVTGDIQEFINEETESTFLQDSEKKERDSLLSMLFNPNTTIRKKFKKQIQQGSHLNKKAGNFIPVSLTLWSLNSMQNCQMMSAHILCMPFMKKRDIQKRAAQKMMLLHLRNHNTIVKSIDKTSGAIVFPIAS